MQRGNFTLGYCTNVHANASLAQTKANLARYALGVKQRVSADSPMGVGLWLSAAAADELARTGQTRAFAGWLIDNGLLPFTMNGFPYGDFHQPVVKHLVYQPTWWEPERLRYTLQLIDILDELLPAGLEGSISTLPIAWPTPLADPEHMQRAASQLLTVAEYLEKLEQRTGRLIYVCLEPEPGCLLDTTSDVVAFFQRYLLAPSSAERTRRYLRVCHDVCHAAVMFEDQSEVFQQYQAAGILVGKVQVSSAIVMRLDELPAEERLATLAELARFSEDRYLHQTCIRDEGRTTLYEDLPAALASAEERPRGEWRTHFHVPIYLERFGRLLTSRDQIDACLAAARRYSACQHYEVETYAWGVLPAELRQMELAAGISEELEWFAARCAAETG